MAKRNARKQVISMRSKSQSTSMYGNFPNRMNITSNNNFDYNENETSLNDVNPRMTESSHHAKSIDKIGMSNKEPIGQDDDSNKFVLTNNTINQVYNASLYKGRNHIENNFTTQTKSQPMKIVKS